MTIKTFNSLLSPYINGLISEKRLNGYKYEFEEYIYHQFDNFILDNNFNDGTITKDLIIQWSIQKNTESNNYRNQRVSFVRQLAIYMNSIGIDAYISDLNKSNKVPDPYVLSIDEIKDFLSVVDNYEPIHFQYPYFPMIYSVLFRMYICCGLRLSEAINLQRRDFNFDNWTVSVLHGKGNVDRIVYMSEDLSEMCQKYDALVDSYFPGRHFFFTHKTTDKPINKTTLDAIFRRLWKQTSHYKNSGRQPTIHSLRHTYVVLTINKWIDEGLDVENMMPYLSRQLGHKSVIGTQYYYHTTLASNSLIRKIDKSINILISSPSIASPTNFNDKLTSNNIILKNNKKVKKVRPENIIFPKVD